MRYSILLLMLGFNCFYSSAQTRYVDRVFSGSKIKTLTYSIRAKDTLQLDVYQPKRDQLEKRPLFVIVHGGGFTSGSRNENSMVTLAQGIAKRGYVVASIDYRLATNKKVFSCQSPLLEGFETFNNAEEDVRDALLYLIKYKDNFKIDASKIILFGSSAGAEIVLNIAYNKTAFTQKTDKYKDLKIAGLIAVSGAIPNSQFIDKSNAIPTVLFHGVDDKVIPYNQGAHHNCSKTAPGYFVMDGSKKIAQKLESLNTSYMLYSFKNRAHNIFNLPEEDNQEAFSFINKVVFENMDCQIKISK
ncbi:alpha/beta hydrolase [uncultured Formosa sp.]|uniref:alpha/beta hydrolase n=1 Tax=uncultured Formosa sp. TaxID=255435 RepID=UPI00262AF29F|nr:alpha/beta hydrolase [uncultured Formosa sp.]